MTDGTAAATAAETGALPDCEELQDMAVCEAEEACEWNVPQLDGYCILRCDQFRDAQSCLEQPFCMWEDERCVVVMT